MVAARSGQPDRNAASPANVDGAADPGNHDAHVGSERTASDAATRHCVVHDGSTDAVAVHAQSTSTGAVADPGSDPDAVLPRRARPGWPDRLGCQDGLARHGLHRGVQPGSRPEQQDRADPEPVTRRLPGADGHDRRHVLTDRGRPITTRRRQGASGSARAFVLRHTRLRAIEGVDGVRLHLADDVLPVWHAMQAETGDPDTDLPYWAVAWAGGLAIARHLQAHPELITGRKVFDLGSGSGLCALVALRAGAREATAADVDPYAAAAIALNARANDRRVTIARGDALLDEPPAVDVVLAGDCWYEGGFAERVLPWLRRARERGADVLIGDPGRRYLPRDDLVELAAYEVTTTTALEDLATKRGRVFRIRPDPSTPPEPIRRPLPR